MTTGVTTQLPNVNGARKTAVINNELVRLNVDIAALQETRLADAGCLREEDFTFYWQGRATDEVRLHGVGFAVRNSLLDTIEPPANGSERIIKLRLQTSDGPMTLFSVYAPTLYSAQVEKDKFYELLETEIRKVDQCERMLILGDFNARVGADSSSWPGCLGAFGIDTINENGQHLLELCAALELCVTNSFFQTRLRHKVSWQHPRSKKWHQLDLILSRRTHLKDFRLTRSYHSADCDTDHALVACNLSIRPKRVRRSKLAGNPRIDVIGTKLPHLVAQFSENVGSALDSKPPVRETDGKWGRIRDTLYEEAKLVFGVRRGQVQDWFTENAAELLPLIEEKRAAFLEHKQHSRQSARRRMLDARSKLQRAIRSCANRYWTQLCSDIQQASDMGDARRMYEGIKKATGPTCQKAAPLKTKTGEVIIGKDRQLERWVEHYSELYDRENLISRDTLDSIRELPVMEELDVPPTMAKLLYSTAYQPK